VAKNPNKTFTIEKLWLAEANRRFSNLNRLMREIPIPSITVNVNDEVRSFIDAFIKEFERIAILQILNSPWQSNYQTEAYTRGIERANRDAKKFANDRFSQFFGLVHAPSTVSLSLPENRNELEFLHARANAALKKWVDVLLEDTKSILHEKMGIVSVDDIHEAIAERINVTTSYARRIASTEVAQAAQRSVIKQAQELSAVSPEPLDVLWVTVDDNHVRRLHASWHLTVMTPEQAARNITISPFGCRCGLRVVLASSITEEQRIKNDKERKQLLAKISN